MPVDEQAAFADARATGRGPAIEAAFSNRVSGLPELLTRQLQGEAISDSEELWLEVLKVQLSEWLSEPENREFRDSLTRKSITTLLEGFGSTATSDEGLADEYAATLFDSMKQLAETDPEMAEQVRKEFFNE